MISRDTVQKVEETLKIEEVISDFVTLKKRGAGYTACCPFHNEKTPSFHVSPSKGIFKCFGCGKAGTAISFVMEYEHCSYSDAVKYIANKYHIPVEEEELSAEEVVARQKRETLLIVTEFAHKFFISQLDTPQGQSIAMAYYRSRGLEDETVRREGLGWAPSERSALTDAAIAAGYKAEYLIECGLAIRRDDGTLVDRFRERVMFPIYSVSGRVIAFSGRTLKIDNPAKYVNSPESEIYVKSKSLLGIYQAKTSISREDKCYLVEGNIDVVTLHQLGIENVVASCGTSLTVEQVRLIHKFTSNLTIMYDGDKAGIKAALRGTDMVLAEGMDVRIVLLPDGEDPDSYGRTHTLEQFNAYIRDNECDFITFKAEMLMSEAGGDPLRRAEKIGEIADTIACIDDPLKRSVCIQECAKKFDLGEDVLSDRVAQTIGKRLKAGKPGAFHEEIAPAVAGHSEDRTVQPVRSEGSVVFENKLMEPTEREILQMLLQFGDCLLEFSTDSPYYDEEPVSVAEFIVSNLEEDYSMSNSLYDEIYQAYCRMFFEEGLPLKRILQCFLDGENRQIADIVSRIAVEKYEITVKNFVNSMTIKSSWLAINVPNTVVNLQIRRIEDRIAALKGTLQDCSDDEQMAVFREIKDLRHTIRKIEEKKVK